MPKIINEFCRDCNHRKIPKNIRNEFNKNVFELFSECPINDDRITGCTTKFLEIDWANFFKHIKEVSKS